MVAGAGRLASDLLNNINNNAKNSMRSLLGGRAAALPPPAPRRHTMVCLGRAAARRGLAAALPPQANHTMVCLGRALCAAPRGQTTLWFVWARSGGRIIVSAGRGAGCAARGRIKTPRAHAEAEAEEDDDDGGGGDASGSASADDEAGARRRAHAAGGRADRAAAGEPGLPGRAAAPPGQRGAVRRAVESRVGANPPAHGYCVCAPASASRSPSS